jgi:hypothetical protein
MDSITNSNNNNPSSLVHFPVSRNGHFPNLSASTTSTTHNLMELLGDLQLSKINVEKDQKAYEQSM